MDLTQFAGVSNFFRQKQLSQVYACVLFAQAQLETGRFTSNIFCNANNAFGMRPAQKRPQDRVGIFPTANGDFALYADVPTSFMDRVALDVYNGIPLPQRLDQVKGYMIAVLEAGYAPEATYLAGWETHFCEVLERNESSMGLEDDDVYQPNENVNNSLGLGNKWIYFLVALAVGFFGFKYLKKKL